MAGKRIESLAFQECYKPIDDIRTVINDKNCCFHDDISSLGIPTLLLAGQPPMDTVPGCSVHVCLYTIQG